MITATSAAPSMQGQVAGLLLFVALVAVLVAARRVYLHVLRRRVLRVLERPLPGRTRDVTDALDRKAS